MEELGRHGLPESVISLWREKEGPELLPVQARAVQRHGLLGGRDVLVVAPTSAGKTFVGEMAAVHSALGRRQAFLLTGTKAVADEKYREFARHYDPLGLRIVLSTRDHREHDGLIERGEFSIAITIYEKLRALLVSQPDLLRTTGVVVADEVQLLGDGQRGPTLETLLTTIRAAGPRPQIVALSAVLSNPFELASWLDADLLVIGERPEELRRGVLHNGEFHYVEQVSGQEGCEKLLEDAAGDSEEQVMHHAAREFARRGESTIVFLPTRWATVHAARALARDVDLPPAEQALSQIEQMEETLSRDALSEVLRRGVAFHNADLTVHQRRIVEEAIRSGEVLLTTATPTLAMGVNLPFVNAVIHSRRFRFLRPLGQHADMPISRGDFETEGGRVARLGFGHPFGRAMVCAVSLWDRDVLREELLNRDFDALEPPLAAVPLDEAALSHVVVAGQTDRPGTVRFLGGTFAGFRAARTEPEREEFTRRAEAAVQANIEGRLVAEAEDGRLVPTPLGHICAAKGLRPTTARELARWAREAGSHGVSDLEALLVAAQTPDGEEIAIGLSESEYRGGHYRRTLSQAAAELNEEHRGTYRALLQAEEGLDMSAHRAMKKALAMHTWLGDERTPQIERRFRMMVGALSRIGGEFSWLLDAMAGVARCVGAAEELASAVEQLANRLPFGVCEAGLPLARLRLRGLDRDRIRRLVAAGYDHPAGLADVPIEDLLAIVPEAVAREIAGQTAPLCEAPSTAVPSAPRGQAAPRPTPPCVVFEVDVNRPDRVVYMGKAVPVRPLEWRLARACAERPGACVPYPELFEALWGPDDIVEPNQIHWHKSRLVRKLRVVGRDNAQRDLIVSIPRAGLMLDLPAEQVQVR